MKTKFPFTVLLLALLAPVFTLCAADAWAGKSNSVLILADDMGFSDLGCYGGEIHTSNLDPQRLGVHGFSMGGNLTMYVAGTERRVKAAVPAVGSAGWRMKRRWRFHSSRKVHDTA